MLTWVYQVDLELGDPPALTSLIPRIQALKCYSEFPKREHVDSPLVQRKGSEPAQPRIEGKENYTEPGTLEARSQVKSR